MTTKNNSIKLAMTADITQDASKDKRNFSGIVNSGTPFNYYGELSIADLSDIEFKAVIPVLIDHDRAKRAGKASLSVSDKGLEISGSLLSNEHGQQIANDSDEGFPWELSAHLQFSATETLQAGETAVINGHDVTGPIKILKKCRVREVSFTPTGVDYNTEAVVLADDPIQAPTQSKNQSKQENGMTLEQALAEIAKLKERLGALEKENETLKEANETLKKSEHQADVEAKLSAAGFKKTEDGKGWQGLSNDTYEVLLSLESKAAGAMIADLTPKGADKKVPDVLLSEQHQPKKEDEAKLSDNPLLANAQQRAKASDGYI